MVFCIRIFRTFSAGRLGGRKQDGLMYWPPCSVCLWKRVGLMSFLILEIISRNIFGDTYYVLVLIKKMVLLMKV